MTRKVFLWLTALVSSPLTISPPDVFAAAKTLSFVEIQQDDRSGLESAEAVALSPDGNHVYVAGSGAVAGFLRDWVSGTLSLVEVERGPADGIDGLDYPASLTVSPDGASVYVASGWYPSGTVVVFNRNPVTGSLSLVEVQREWSWRLHRPRRVVQECGTYN